MSARQAATQALMCAVVSVACGVASGIANAATGPQNTALPTLSGTASAESTLTASPGTWSGSPTFTYLFQRCNDTLSACAATGPNLLAQNPGAEREDTPAPLWQPYGATLTRDSLHGKSGNWSFKLAADGTANQQGVEITVAIPVSPSTPYAFSAWIYSAQPRAFRLGMEEYATPTSTTHLAVQTKQVNHPGGGWALVSFTPTTGAGTGAVRVYVDGYPTTAAYTIWLDDLELTKAVPAQSPQLTLSMADAGSRIRAVVTATGSAGTATATSAATGYVAERQPPTPITPPSLSGDASVGGTLALSVGTWDDHGLPSQSGESFTFERCDDQLVRCATTGDNLLGNADFEAGMTPWQSYGATVARDRTHGKSGRWSLKVTTAGAAQNEGIDLPDESSVAVLPYHPYTFSAWVYSAQPKTFRIGLEEFTTAAPAGWLDAQSRQQSHPGGGWALLSFTATTRGATRFVNPFIDGYPSSAAYTMWVDNLELVHAIPASSTAFKLSSTSAGSRIRARVVGSSNAGERVAFSNASGVVADTGSTPTLPPPADSTPPSLSGTLAVGSTLTLSPGTWSGSPTSFSYRIERCDSTLARCAGIGIPNLLTNLAGGSTDPTFESAIAPWVGYGSTTLSRDGAHGKSGQWSLKVQTAGASNLEGVHLPAGAPVDADSGHTYTFSAWVYSATARTFRIGFDQLETKTGGSSLGTLSGSVSHPGGGWALLAFTGTAAPTAHYLNPFIDGSPATAAYTIWVENVVLADTGATSTSTSHVITPEEAGSRLRVVVTATNANGSATAVSDPTGYVAVS